MPKAKERREDAYDVNRYILNAVKPECRAVAVEEPDLFNIEYAFIRHDQYIKIIISPCHEKEYPEQKCPQTYDENPEKAHVTLNDEWIWKRQYDKYDIDDNGYDDDTPEDNDILQDDHPVFPNLNEYFFVISKRNHNADSVKRMRETTLIPARLLETTT